MSNFFIGVPGEKPRLLVNDLRSAKELCEPGDVIIKSDEVKDFLIAKDGRSLTTAPVSIDLEKSILRARRNALLAETDWTQLGDSALTKKKKDEYLAYRKSLRDIPEIQAGKKVEDIVWPKKPA